MKAARKLNWAWKFYKKRIEKLKRNCRTPKSSRIAPIYLSIRVLATYRCLPSLKTKNSKFKLQLLLILTVYSRKRKSRNLDREQQHLAPYPDSALFLIVPFYRWCLIHLGSLGYLALKRLRRCRSEIQPYWFHQLKRPKITPNRWTPRRAKEAATPRRDSLK